MPNIMDKYISTPRPITVKFHYLEEQDSLQAFKSHTKNRNKIVLDFSTQLETRQCSNMFKILKEDYFPPRILQNIKYDDMQVLKRFTSIHISSRSYQKICSKKELVTSKTENKKSRK